MTLPDPCFVGEGGVRFDHNVERAEFNQYWYSAHTIATFADEIRHHGTACAFLSTPSLYFAMAADRKGCGDDGGTDVGTAPAVATLVSRSRLFEYDTQWKEDPGFVFYDFHRPEAVPVQHFGAFDYVVADPPFITEDVWTAYIKTAKLLLCDGGKVLFTTVMENHSMLEGLWDGPLFIAAFRPSITRLTYQYVCFTNYETTKLTQANEELPPDDPKVVAAIHMANNLRESEKAFVIQAQQRDRREDQPLPATQHNGNSAGGDIAGIPMSAMKWGYIPDGLAVYANGDDATALTSAADSGNCKQDVEVDYGETYALVVDLRGALDNFKRHVDLLQRSLDQMLRLHQKHTKTECHSGGTVPEAGKEVNAELAVCRERFNTMVGEMRGTIASVEALEARLAVLTGEATVTYVGAMRECVDTYANVPLRKQELNELAADATRKYKSPIFNRMRELLQCMKDIKKCYQRPREDGSSGK